MKHGSLFSSIGGLLKLTKRELKKQLRK